MTPTRSTGSLPDEQAERKTEIGVLLDGIARAQQVAGRVGVHQSPAAALKARQRRVRPGIVDAVQQKFAPVVRRHLVKRGNNVIQRVRLHLRRNIRRIVGRAVEELGEIVQS